MALTYICHIYSTANEKLPGEIAVEIKITSLGKKEIQQHLVMVRKRKQASGGSQLQGEAQTMRTLERKIAF